MDLKAFQCFQHHFVESVDLKDLASIDHKGAHLLCSCARSQSQNRSSGVAPMNMAARLNRNYLVIGLSTIAVSCWTTAYLPNSPIQAKFLNRAERVALLRHISSNATGTRRTQVEEEILGSMGPLCKVYLEAAATLEDAVVVVFDGH
ncbi:hypothetical protein AC578_100 [Pseudocercospora eumusae]|uniref:Uncharacterized protein n=1 Tax=Pseudocercospora eumusae TaxID=321146 RepID=A0A139HP80_9PEZI|nr:hypothetical protein AC578_100 [Pseudocercospora eumusae]